MIVLASASPRRVGLIAAAGLAFTTAAQDVDETPPAGVLPEDAAQAIACRKALAAAAATDLPVLAADTIVVAADGEILGKPEDAADAARMLRKLSGTTHRVVTGVCLALARGARVVLASETTHVTMRALAAEEIRGYVASGECFGKAGAYAIQETGDRFVTRVEGSWTNVVGLPMELVMRILREAGPVEEASR